MIFQKTIKALSKSISMLLVLFLAGGVIYQASGQEKEGFNWISMEEAQTKAAEDGKKIFVFVEAEWCGICRQMERQVFPTDKVKSIAEQKYHTVMIDLDSREKITFNGEEMTEREFAKKMNVSATPTSLFIHPNGEVLAHHIGFDPADRFAALLTYVDSSMFGEVTFDEYLQMQ